MEMNPVIIHRLRRRLNSPVRYSHTRHSADAMMETIARIYFRTARPALAQTRYRIKKTVALSRTRQYKNKWKC